ncbi:MAG TPA: DUF4402 domain-containing protein [Sphingomicrobium sp.]|nr:DUF4402 domain-containing protein [Sphingomicrobium sp.]
MASQIRLALLSLCAAGFAAQANAASQNASVKATVVKPLTLTKIQDLNFGTVMLKTGVWAGATVSVSRTGVRSCANANTICTDTATQAQFNAAGSNSQTVKVTAPNVTLVNQSDATKTLLLTVDAPATIALPNSGNKGLDFGVGGSITLTSTTVPGTYSGTLNVTVDYQ